MDLEQFRNHPLIRRIQARVEFDAAAMVLLGDWGNLDEATVWLDCRWRSLNHGYRRRINVDQQTAYFELAVETDAIEFALRFG